MAPPPENTLPSCLPPQIYVGIPGLAGTPHVDALARAYNFTSQAPFRARHTLTVSDQPVYTYG